MDATVDSAAHLGETMTQDVIVLDLPKNVIESIVSFQQQCKTGQIVLNFNRGKIESFEAKTHTRVTVTVQ